VLLRFYRCCRLNLFFLKIDKLTWFKIKLVEKVVWASKVTEKRQVLGKVFFQDIKKEKVSEERERGEKDLEECIGEGFLIQ
jgi:hypothetical protein